MGPQGPPGPPGPTMVTELMEGRGWAGFIYGTLEPPARRVYFGSHLGICSFVFRMCWVDCEGSTGRWTKAP